MSDQCKHGRMHCIQCHMSPGHPGAGMAYATELEKAKATIAEQAKMIEHLRGGPTPLYTAVDMANAARDERNGIAESLIERLAIAYPDSEAMMTVECFADWLSKEMKS